MAVVLLAAIVTVTLGIATPARAGLLDSLLGQGSSPSSAADDGLAGTWSLDGRPCKAIAVPTAVPTAAPFGISSCQGVRPGALVEVNGGACTLNFLFTGEGGERYMGTAGHCVLGTSPLDQENGERRFLAGQGPVASDGQGNRIGEFVYAIQQEPKDFALVRLDDGVEASAQVCQFGGPTGINEDVTSGLSPTLLSNFGNPLGLGTGLTAKTFLALNLADPDQVAATGLALPGDSGSPVLDQQGRAVGVLVNVGVQEGQGLLSLDNLNVGVIGITRLAPQLDRAEQVLGTDLELQTAPRL